MALLVPALAPAQQVWPVSNQTELLAAIAAAAPGDVIQLARGTYDDFTLNKGLTVRGPATVKFKTAAFRAIVPYRQVAQLVDLQFQVAAGVFGGTARLDGCNFSGTLSVSYVSVVVERCHGVSLIAQDSVVSVHESTFYGSNASTIPFAYAMPGIMASGTGSLHVSTSTLTGGWGIGSVHGPNQVPAAGIQTSVPTWVADTHASGGDDAGGGFPMPGAPGIEVRAAKTFIARGTLSGGFGNGVLAPPTTGNAVTDPTLLGVTMSPLSRGQGATITVFADQPGVPLAILASVGLNDPQLLPFVTQPLFLGNAPVLVAAGSASVPGQLSLGWQVLPDPMLENVSISFVGVGLGGAGVQITPTAGGLIR